MASTSWPRRIWLDLQPTPGRLAGAARIVLTTVITLVLLEALRIPFASIGLYFIFIVSRESPSVSLRTGVGAMVTLLLSVATVLAVVILSNNDPMVRLLSVSVVGFVAALLSVSLSQPTLPPIWGFIYCTLIALWERRVPATSSVKLSLWILAATGLPVVVSVAVEFLFSSRRPVDELLEQRRIRYEALSVMFRLYSQPSGEGETGRHGPLDLSVPSTPLGEARLRVIRLAIAGQVGMQRLYNAIVDRNLDPGALPVAARVRITMLAQLMDVASAYATQYAVPETPENRARCLVLADLCHGLSQNLAFGPASRSVLQLGPDSSLLDHVEHALQDILLMPAGTGAPEDRTLIALPSARVPLLNPGALRNPDNVAFALKLSLCATLCYIVYFAADWPGISTSVTTVFIAGLSSSAAIKQRLIFRVAGSILGGLILGIGATVFLFPRMDTIASLVMVIAAISFVCAWIAGGRSFSYVGLQTAFAFYLVAFEGFRAPTELAPARDRFVGIVLALVVMAFVFDQLWPVRTVTLMRRTLASVLQNDARLFRLDQASNRLEERLELANGFRDRVGKGMASLRTMNETVEYEFGPDHDAHARAGNAILQAALSSVGLFWNELAILHTAQDGPLQHEPQLVSLRHQIAGRIDQMAAAVTELGTYQAVDLNATIDPALLARPDYGEYARHVLARFHDLQENVAALSGQV